MFAFQLQQEWTGGTLGVWIPAQTWIQVKRVFGPHDFSMDPVLFNCKVVWSRDQKVARDKIDFSSVALDETGHDLGLTALAIARCRTVRRVPVTGEASATAPARGCFATVNRGSQLP